MESVGVAVGKLQALSSKSRATAEWKSKERFCMIPPDERTGVGYEYIIT
jgi:hypothetical protein